MAVFAKLINISATALLLMTASCSDERFNDTIIDTDALPGDRAETFEVPLRLHTDKPTLIGKPLVNDIPSRAEGDDTADDPEKAAEEALHDIWVFQYDNDGKQLIAPRYYEVTSTEIRKLNIRLAEGNDSRVFVLANTCDPEWAKDKDLSTQEKFIDYKYPFTEDNVEMGEDEYLLMEGSVKDTIRKETDLDPIDIHLTRMMAKISFKYVTAEAAKGLVVNRVIINNMPEDMRMEETPKEENYPIGDDFATRSVTLDKQLVSGSVYTFYMPANRRGKTSNTDPKLKNNDAPDKALYVQLFVSSKTNGSNYLYTIYLGENDYNDFNVRRNHNYNITLNIKSENRDDRVLAAPANCYVLGFKEEIMFDPYNRTETGGGWKYSDYVNKKDPAKKIAQVKVLWQEQNVIGDNTKGDKVWLDEYNRVHVKSLTTAGNAVIAGYNEANEIVWSWHIWVNDDKPAEISKAVAYKTFGWDGSGIKKAAGRVVKGRSLMQCNLGARSATAQNADAYGLIYQWGRKDPFFTQTTQNASAGNVKYITDNANKQIAMPGGDGTAKDTGKLFDFTLTSKEKGRIEWVLKHPTVFLGTGGSSSSDDYTAYNNGDWFWDGEDKLWGGKPFAEATVKFLVLGKGKTENGITMNHDAWLSNNGATEKSLFDPCPAGWMVPPHDMWLTFTEDGRNAGWGTSYNGKRNVKFQSGLKGHLCYVEAWRAGKYLFFPSPGWRRAYGQIGGQGSCGNYHTTTPSTNGTVNCFHIHAQDALLTFESSNHYTRRAFAGPIRCVRDVDD